MCRSVDGALIVHSMDMTTGVRLAWLRNLKHSVWRGGGPEVSQRNGGFAVHGDWRHVHCVVDWYSRRLWPDSDLTWLTRSLQQNGKRKGRHSLMNSSKYWALMGIVYICIYINGIISHAQSRWLLSLPCHGRVMHPSALWAAICFVHARQPVCTLCYSTQWLDHVWECFLFILFFRNYFMHWAGKTCTHFQAIFTGSRHELKTFTIWACNFRSCPPLMN